MHIEALSNRSDCRLISAAFDEALSVLGLTPEEVASLFRVGKGRPDWPGVAARGPIRMGVTDEDLDGLRVECSPLALPGGRAFLASDRAGEVRLEPASEADLHLLPQPLNLLLAQQWARRARFPLHGAALRWKGRGVLILGERSAGKSSLVLAASSLGGEVVSDDWLLTGVLRGQVRVERLREFLMFRPGAPWQAFGKEVQTLTGLTIVPGPDDRHVLPIHGPQPAFPAWIPVERMVFLQAPERERPARSRLEPIHQSRLLSGLVKASMPRLLTGEFSKERGRLMTAFRTLISDLPGHAATIGLDLIESPEATLDRLLGPDLNA